MPDAPLYMHSSIPFSAAGLPQHVFCCAQDSPKCRARLVQNCMGIFEGRYQVVTGSQMTSRIHRKEADSFDRGTKISLAGY